MTSLLDIMAQHSDMLSYCGMVGCSGTWVHRSGPSVLLLSRYHCVLVDSPSHLCANPLVLALCAEKTNSDNAAVFAEVIERLFLCLSMSTSATEGEHFGGTRISDSLTNFSLSCFLDQVREKHSQLTAKAVDGCGSITVYLAGQTIH